MHARRRYRITNSREGQGDNSREVLLWERWKCYSYCFVLYRDRKSIISEIIILSIEFGLGIARIKKGPYLIIFIIR